MNGFGIIKWKTRLMAAFSTHPIVWGPLCVNHKHCQYVSLKNGNTHYTLHAAVHNTHTHSVCFNTLSVYDKPMIAKGDGNPTGGSA